MKRIPRCMVSLVFVWCVAGLAAVPPRDPQELVKTTTDQVIARVKAERESLRADPLRMNSLVDELIVPHFDFVRMSRWVLGKYWHSATEAQKSQFVDQFRQLLIRTYASTLVEFADHEIRYLPLRAEANATRVTVKVQVQQQGETHVPLDYRMHVKDNDWKVYDISVDGISLLATYRGEFDEKIRQTGLDALISKLATKNVKK